MDGSAQFLIAEDGGGGTMLSLSGSLLISTIGRLQGELRGIATNLSRIDLSETVEIDTIGAWVIYRLAKEHDAEITGTGPQVKRLLDAVERASTDVDIAAPRDPVWLRVPNGVARQVIEVASGLKGVVAFFGQILIGFFNLVRHPSRFPGRSIVRQMELVGVSALPIIGLMSFLIGVVIAQQGAVQLEQFGAVELTINLVGRITLRELGVLMTAIMVAGRSGSAFAAQIGTMKLTEEVDAMRTIGISPVEVLVIPRIIACTFMMVLLGFYSSVIGIIGGAFVGQFFLGIPFWIFIERIQDVVPIRDLWVGLVKAPVFGLIVALTGCYHGMQVKGNSEEVGLRTTMAVVSAIFAVIVLDAFFAVFFTEVGWG